MRAALATRSSCDVHIRSGEAADLDILLDLETRVFSTDRMSRRSLRHFLSSQTATVVVAELSGRIAGCAVVLYRPNSAIARLYSIAVEPANSGRGIGPALLAACEEAALAHGCHFQRLEVHEANRRAIQLYSRAGYRQFGRYEGYYDDKGNALRFEKRLTPSCPGLRKPPPYVHQTTEFTCGPACLMMAMSWADRRYRPTPACEFRLWREATTIFMTAGLGGCEPYGMAVALKRHGLDPSIHVSRAGPYFLDTVQAADKRRVMQVAQEDFRREARALDIPTHLTPLAESGFMAALDSGASAIVLVCGYHMVPRAIPHWVFAFGRDSRNVLVHDPAAPTIGAGGVVQPETYAVPWDAFARMSRYGRDRLSASIVIRKGRPQ